MRKIFGYISAFLFVLLFNWCGYSFADTLNLNFASGAWGDRGILSGSVSNSYSLSAGGSLQVTVTAGQQYADGRSRRGGYLTHNYDYIGYGPVGGNPPEYYGFGVVSSDHYSGEPKVYEDPGAIDDYDSDPYGIENDYEYTMWVKEYIKVSFSIPVTVSNFYVYDFDYYKTYIFLDFLHLFPKHHYEAGNYTVNGDQTPHYFYANSPDLEKTYSYPDPVAPSYRLKGYETNISDVTSIKFLAAGEKATGDFGDDRISSFSLTELEIEALGSPTPDPPDPDPSPVPEPTTMLLLGSGLIALAGIKKNSGKG